jgi:hypothetical protein
VEASVSEPIKEFFERLSAGGPGALPPRANGSLRIDLGSGATTERWFLTIGKGAVSVSHRNSKDLFEGIVTGRANAMTGALRGVVSLEGDPTLLVLFQRALPGPPASAKRGSTTKGARS